LQLKDFTYYFIISNFITTSNFNSDFTIEPQSGTVGAHDASEIVVTFFPVKSGESKCNLRVVTDAKKTMNVKLLGSGGIGKIETDFFDAQDTQKV
tara:strand:- start:2354 stop:2638 length:285 start_codon:yes stop_codon:yes gene_type:complete